MSNLNSTHRCARLIITLWYVKTPDGRTHICRESEGDFHMTTCGKFVKGCSRPVQTRTGGISCPECEDRFNNPHIVVGHDDADPVPPIIQRGAGLKSERTRMFTFRKSMGRRQMGGQD